jgi:hypothetical protein
MLLSRAMRLQDDEMSAVFIALSNQYTHPLVSRDEETVFRSSQALPVMMKEIRMVGTLEREDSLPVLERKARIRRAFEIIGTNAAPLSPELGNEFLLGRNPGDAAWALIQVGEAGWPYLLQGLTNSRPEVQAAAAATIPHLDVRATESALPYLCRFLTNGPVALRCTAAYSLGHVKVRAQSVSSPLVASLEDDPDPVVRVASAKSLGEFAKTNEAVFEALKWSSASNTDAYVRRMVSKILTAAHSAGTPNETHAEK